MSSIIYPVAVFMLCFGAGQAYPSGAPQSACVTMTPGHGVESTSVNPYTVTASASYYTPGVPITVTISGSSFAGFLLQARALGTTTPLGTFSNFPANTKGTTCGTTDSAATHSSTTLKTSPSFTWTPPSGLTGSMEFVATIAAEKRVWWRNIKSSSLSLATTTTSTTTTTTSSPPTTPKTTTTTTTTVTPPTTPTTTTRSRPGGTPRTSLTTTTTSSTTSTTTTTTTTPTTTNVTSTTASNAIPTIGPTTTTISTSTSPTRSTTTTVGNDGRTSTYIVSLLVACLASTTF